MGDVYIICLCYFIEKMNAIIVILIGLFVIGQILIIYYIKKKFAFRNKRRDTNDIFEAEQDLEERKSKGMLEYRRFVKSTLQYNY